MTASGMRGQLQMQSLLTGKLKIVLKMAPEEPGEVMGGDLEYVEIPTVPTSLSQVKEELNELPIQDNIAATYGDIEMPFRETAGKLIRAGRKKKVAGKGANFGAVAVPLIIHRQCFIPGSGIHPPTSSETMTRKSHPKTTFHP